MPQVKVRDVMSRSVITVTPDAPVKDALELLLAHDVSGLPVLDEGGELVGIVTEGDLLSKEAGIGPRGPGLVRAISGILHGTYTPWHQKIEGVTVRDVMTRGVETVAPDEDLHLAARYMMRKGVKRLPVVDTDGELAGIISRHDVLTVFHRPDEELQRLASEQVARYLPDRPDDRLEITVENGVVTLRGTVYHETDGRIAELVAKDVDGVIAVRNELGYRVLEPRTYE